MIKETLLLWLQNVLMEAYDIKAKVKIHINKRIPIAGGMAGGSADCAAVLRGVNQLFQLGLTDEQLQEYGVKLGADVPYCIVGGTKRAQGIGEILTDLPITAKVLCDNCKAGRICFNKICLQPYTPGADRKSS